MLGWRTHEAAAHIPSDWLDDEGEPVARRRTDDGDYQTFGTMENGMRMPAFIDGVRVCASATFDDPELLLSGLSTKPDAGISDVCIQNSEPTSLRQALESVGWDGWSWNDEQEGRGPIDMRLAKAFATPIQSDVRDRTMEAYLSTEYIIRSSIRAVMTIGVECRAIHNLYASLNLASVAFVTAWNPYGLERDPRINALANTHLLTDIEDFGRLAIEGIGKHPLSVHPGEESHAIFGMNLDDATHLGHVHGQDAVVWAGQDAIPKLVLLR